MDLYLYTPSPPSVRSQHVTGRPFTNHEARHDAISPSPDTQLLIVQNTSSETCLKTPLAYVLY
jgi:hypothetical protein